MASENKVTLEVSNEKRIKNVKVLKNIPEEKYFKILDWEIGKSRITDVQVVLGGIISHHGDAANSVYSICYTGKDSSVLTFESSEIGGEEHIITSVSLEESAQVSARNKLNCESSSKISKEVKFGDIAFLQERPSKIKKIFKNSSKSLDNLIVYYFNETIVENLKEWNIAVIFEIYTKKDKIEKIVLTKTKTN